MLISKKKFLKITIIVLFLGIVLFFWGSIDSRDSSSAYYTMNLLSFASFIIFIITNPFQFISPYTFIFLFIYLYNCGQLWMNLFGFRIPFGSFVISRFSDNLLTECVFYFIMFSMLTHLFGLIFSKNKLKIKTDVFNWDKALNDYNNILFKKTMYILLIVIIPLLVLLDINQVVLANNGGYTVALYSRSNNVFFEIANSMCPLLIFGIIICEENKNKRKVVALYGIFRYIIMMVLVGYRMQAMAFLCGIFISWTLRDNEKTLKKKAILVVILGIVLLIVTTIVSQLRNGYVNNNMSIEDLLLNAIKEIGGSFIDIPIVFESIGNIGFAYGKTYLYGLINIIPFIIRLFPNSTQYLTLSSTLNDNFVIYSSSSLGGNIYAEMYYNFGWYALLVTPILGYLISMINKKVDSNKMLISKTIDMYLFFIFALYIRGNMGEVTVFLRNIVYLLIIYSVFKAYYVRKKQVKRRMEIYD
ncbi:O-antigen polysaccharide polymerase Wzy [Clostridium perfringens]|nr:MULTISPECIES: O-antigen polysaccharide polymerase Wzy [Clostridium]MDK7590346.1 O-antigen polysaccharide polymerase Wzy [Clostridium sp. UMB9555B]MDK7628607.1 O-antigen polysaccharide polymerase Wzy [Clostridium sp. UMB9555A]